MKNADQPASPVTPYSDHVRVYGGLTKREHIAVLMAQAMVSNELFLKNMDKKHNAAESLIQPIADEAVELADAILKSLGNLT